MFWLALAANVTDLVTLYTVFRAFSYRIDAGSLTVGVAIETVLGLVQVTPQGVGVVEGGMALTYSSLGVPAALGAAVVIIYRGVNGGYQPWWASCWCSGAAGGAAGDRPRAPRPVAQPPIESILSIGSIGQAQWTLWTEWT